MTTPITQLPTPPQPSDSPVEFDRKAFNLLGGLPQFVDEANRLGNEMTTLGVGVDTAAQQSAQNAQSASASADSSASSATAAGQSASSASTSATSALDSADKAEKYKPVESPTPPENPTSGKQWINTTTGRKYTWFNDGNSSQWVEIEASVLVAVPDSGNEVSKHAILSYATKAQADFAAATLPDGQEVIARDVQERYKVQGGALVLQESLKFLKLSEAAEQKLSGPISAPYVWTGFRGLKISDFLTSNAGWSGDKSAAVQAAVNELISNERYHGLDLEGRLLLVGSPIEFGSKPLYFPHKYIANGHMYASSTIPDGSYIFDFQLCPDLRNFKMLNMSFSGNRRAGWVRMAQKYKYIPFESCFFSGAGGLGTADQYLTGKKIGIYDPDTPSGGSHELGLYNCYLDSGQYTAGKNQVAIYSRNPDVFIQGNLAQYFKDFFVGNSGSYQFANNHVWSNYDVGDTLNSFVRMTSAANGAGFVATGNYIDGVQTIFGNQKNPSQPIGGVSMVGNIFLLTPDLPADFNFVILKPAAAGTNISGFDMSGNTYDSNATSKRFFNIGVDSSEGSIDPNGIYNLNLADRAFSSATQQGVIYRSTAQYNAKIIPSDSGYIFVNFDAAIPPFAKLRRIVSAQYSANSSSSPRGYATTRLNDTSRGVHVGVTQNGIENIAAEGRIEVVADINSNSRAAD